MKRNKSRPASGNKGSPLNLLQQIAAINLNKQIIDSSLISNFSKLIANLALKAQRLKGNQQNIDFLKSIIDLILGFQHNLHNTENQSKHQCSQEDILNFFNSLTYLFVQLSLEAQTPNFLTQIGLIQIFSSLLDQNFQNLTNKKIQIKQNVTNALLPSIQPIILYSLNVSQCIRNFILSSQINSKNFNFNQRKKSNNNERKSISKLLIAFLATISQNHNFFQYICAYFMYTASTGDAPSFKKTLLILRFMNPSFKIKQEKCEKAILKALALGHLNIVGIINSWLSIPKCLHKKMLPSIILLYIHKLKQQNPDEQTLSILQELNNAQLPTYKQQKQFQGGKLLQQLTIFFFQMLFQWFVIQPVKQELKTKDQEGIIHEFSIIIQRKSINRDEKYYILIGQLLQKISIYSKIKKLLVFQTMNDVCFGQLKQQDICKKQYLRQLVLNILPCYIKHFLLLPQQKCFLRYAISGRIAELNAKNQKHLNILWSQLREAYYQLLQPQALNYHFVICVINIKYQKKQEKQNIRKMVLKNIIIDLQRPEQKKDSKNLIINLVLYLKTLQNIIPPIPLKLKTKSLLNDFQKNSLIDKLDLSALMSVYPRQCINKQASQLGLPQQYHQMRKLLNQNLASYSCQQFNIFYTVVVAINDLIKIQYQQKSVLNQLNYMRRALFMLDFQATLDELLKKITLLNNNQNNLQFSKRSILLLMLKLNQKKKPQINNKDKNSIILLLRSFLKILHQKNQDILLNSLYNDKLEKQIKQLFNSLITCLQQKHMIKFYSFTSKHEANTNFILIRETISLLNYFKKDMQINEQILNQIKCYNALYITAFSLQNNAQIQIYKQIKIFINTIRLEKLLKNNVNNNADKNINFCVQQINSQIQSFMKIFIDGYGESKIQYLKKMFNIKIQQFLHSILMSPFNNINNKQLFEIILKMAPFLSNKQANYFQKIIQKLLLNEQQIYKKIIYRAKKGITLSQKQRQQYLNISKILYKFISQKIINQSNKFIIIVQELIQLDLYTDPFISAFILKQISAVFTKITQKSQQICQVIFNYITTLTEVFVGEQKLQIATFICSFFGLELRQKNEIQYSAFDKKISLTCGYGQNFRCLKCCGDNKPILCQGCAITCHANHPVCYINYISPNDSKLNIKCNCSQYGSCKLASTQKNISNNNNLFVRPGRGMISEPPGFHERIQKYGKYSVFLQGDRQKNIISRYERQNDPSFLLLQQHLFGQNELPPRKNVNEWLEKQQSNNEINKIFAEFTGNKQISKSKQNQTQNYQFNQENYQRQQIQIQNISHNIISINQHNALLKKQNLLSKFIQLMMSFCQKKAAKSKSTTNLQYWKFGYTPNNISRINSNFILRLHNAGTYSFQVRKQNNINLSCILIKRNITQTNKFIIIASGSQVIVFAKQKVLSSFIDLKSLNNTMLLSKCNMNFQIHTVQVSPLDQNVICAAGIHNLIVLNISSDGSITKTSLRHGISNFYINKIKCTKMGIFVGIQKQIRLLNYTCKHLLTIRAQQNNTMIRQWSVFEKAAGCQVYFVCPNGHIFTCQILPGDEGRKEFITKVTDSRTKFETGASIIVKQISQMGRYLCGSFKDGSNIFGKLENEQVEDMININLKGLKFQKNIFDTFFIFGHIQFIKLVQTNEIVIVCTVKKYFPPEMGFHQGYLIAIKLKKDGTSETIILNDQILCEYFSIVRVGSKNFVVYSTHVDGSIFVTSLSKINKNHIQQECVLMKQTNTQNVNSENISDPKDNIKKIIQKKLQLSEVIKHFDISYTYSYRQNCQNLKIIDYKLNKKNQEYQFKQVNYNKVVMGLVLPFFGDAQIPTRKITNTFQVGFTQLEALYFFGKGGFNFTCRRSQNQKYNRQNNSQNSLRLVERLQNGIGGYSNQLLNNLANSIKQQSKQEFLFISRSLDTIKVKLPRFDQFFSNQNNDQLSSIQKTASIIKMFLQKCKKQGLAVDNNELLVLVQGLKSIIISSPKQMFPLIKDIILLALNLYQKQSNIKFTLPQDQNYPLRAATQQLLNYYFTKLKIDISQNDLDYFLDFLLSILFEDQQLMTFYVAKYSSLFSHIHKRLKKADTEKRAQILIQIYSFAYPILQYCQVPCPWILTSICGNIYLFINSVKLRQKLYIAFGLTQKITYYNWIKTIFSPSQVVVDIPEVILPKISQQQPLDPMTQFNNMFNRGQIDEQTLLKMIEDLSMQDFNNSKKIQEQNPVLVMQQMQPELVQQMIEQKTINNQFKLHIDLLQQCLQTFSDNLQFAYSRILVLYVMSKAINKSQFNEVMIEMLKKIQKLISDVDLKAEGDRLTSILCYCSLFNNIIQHSIYLKDAKNNQYYQQLQKLVFNKLNTIKLQSVTKIKNAPNYLGKVFKGDKTPLNTHIAYGLTQLLIKPCNPQHVLLSLQCYWLLPNTKQFYSRLKDQSNIKEGVQSGNITKIYQTAKASPAIWQQSSHLPFIQNWIQNKKPMWELALELLALYYQS